MPLQLLSVYFGSIFYIFTFIDQKRADGRAEELQVNKITDKSTGLQK